MTLTEQSQLIDDMIKEREDYTIKDFLDLRQELRSISSTNNKMNSTELIQAIDNTLNKRA